MNKITIIIGLQGSGKTTFSEFFPEPRIVYSDWGWEFNTTENGDILSSPHEESRFNELLNSIKTSNKVIIEGSYFCNHKFLCQMEYHLNLNFPNIEIKKYYFENNTKKAKANVLYREALKGAHWKKVKDKDNEHLIFIGAHFNNKKHYEIIIENLEKLSKNYIIPERFPPLNIQVQDKKYYKGWKALIKEE